MMLPIFSVGREVTIETTESPLSHGSCTPTSTPFNNGPECTSTPVPPLENDSQSTDGASQGNDSHSTDGLVPQTTPKIECLPSTSYLSTEPSMKSGMFFIGFIG
uniref:Uncharacterized protein n=1 Tax=Cacopsylla melanoneura TaxID=428564 RepID=A0A8D8PVF4_9HEMI